MLRSLMDAGLVHTRMGTVYNETRAHHSLFMEYDANNTTPIALRTLTLHDDLLPSRQLTNMEHQTYSYGLSCGRTRFIVH